MVSATDEHDYSTFLLNDVYLNEQVLARDNKKAYTFFKIVEKEMRFEPLSFQTHIWFHPEITHYHNLIDMFIEVSEGGIDNFGNNIGYAF
jgi:hypothetical protein